PVIGTKKIKLAVGHLTAPFASFLGGLIEQKPDIIFIYSPPLFMGIAGYLLNLFKGVPLVMGVQDLHPQCYIDQGLLKNKAIIKFWEEVEKFCYRRASLITVHSEGNKKHIFETKGIKEDKVRVLPNWIDTDEVKPLPRDNEFANRFDLTGKFVVGYAGTLGMSQGFMSVIDAANILKNRKDIDFFIVGDGIEKNKMIERVKELNLDNVRFLEMQPKDIYPYVVASCDVGIVTLNDRVKTPVVPSKILSIMAAARPVLASIPHEGDAAKLIKEANCGINVAVGQPDKLAEKILYLYGNKDACKIFAESGRKYVVEKFSLKKAVNNVENLFYSAIEKFQEKSQ
ncbi:MAG: hypothetical protein A2077_02530, partial [Nitrospirae bacterium GWC2_46_6]